LLLAGIVMLVFPGPGLVTIAAGLAILAREFQWARTLLDWLKTTATRVGRTLRLTSTRVNRAIRRTATRANRTLRKAATRVRRALGFPARSAQSAQRVHHKDNH
jgi:uncharacterized protein (TIGR02611 family)